MRMQVMDTLFKYKKVDRRLTLHMHMLSVYAIVRSGFHFQLLDLFCLCHQLVSNAGSSDTAIRGWINNEILRRVTT